MRKSTVTLHSETKSKWLPTLAAITSMASKYTRFQVNKTPYVFIPDNDENVDNDKNRFPEAREPSEVAARKFV